MWTEDKLQTSVLNWLDFKQSEQNEIKELLNQKLSFCEYQKQNNQRLKALANTQKNREILNGVKQLYPRAISSADLQLKSEQINGCAIVLTAGGEGERLRLSLLDSGYSQESLENFTKATFPLPNLAGLGALQINLILLASIEQKYNITLPVVVTTGPKGTTTADYIPKILKKNQNFGLKQLLIVEQLERAHLTDDGQIIVYKNQDNIFQLLTNPDETGGPLMALRNKGANNESALEWFSSLNCTKIMVLQATALYNPELLFLMAVAGKECDGMGVGIQREKFPSNDPYGTFVLTENNSKQQLLIIEKDIRNEETYQIKDQTGEDYLPFNTGFYLFDTSVLANNELPDYATPPKETLPALAKAPKIGYAATDIFSLTQNPLVLTIPNDYFAVIKTVEDLHTLTNLAQNCELINLLTKYQENK